MLFDSYNLALFIRIVSSASDIARVGFRASNSVVWFQIGLMDDSGESFDISDKLQEIF